MAENGTRVAMVGRYPRTPGKPGGGPETVAEILADGLARSGQIEVHFITSVTGLDQKKILVTDAGTTVHYLPSCGRLETVTGYWVDCRRIRRELRTILPDIVHVHTTLNYARAALERGYPSILAIRGIHRRETPFQKGLSRLQFMLGDLYENDAIRRAKHLVFLNRYTMNTVHDLVGDAEVRYIDNPADDSFFDIPNSEEDGRVLVLGMIRRLKGQEYAIRAVAKLRARGIRTSLYCVGPVQDADYDKEIRNLIRNENVEDCVYLPGNANRAQAQMQLSKAQILLVPSMVENAPLVISEGMAAGKAIIATPAGGITEMIDNGRDGIIVPFADSDAMADSIQSLLSDPKKRASICTEARRTAEKRFRLSVSVEKTLNYYRSMLHVANK
ncbi:MAG: glycosyltransferase family 4 protein [Armatimonadota bacterium]